ncbi:MAG: T9SS type A sorting domain-containing protein [Bacteroidales bacterium]|nr:T9SS type A sorting domain-containing protein [Bacteroidales bacterium]
MKLLLSTISFLILTGLNAQDTIPNNGFEEWSNNYSPLHWETTNIVLPPGTFNCNRTGNAYDGNYAIQLKTIELNGFKVPGVVTLGKMEMYQTSGGIPFTGRPLSLKGYYRHPSSGDQILAAVEFFKEGILIGTGSLYLNDSVGQYTEFVVPITFNNPSDPDTMNITLLSDQNKTGSMVMFDGLYFDYNVTGVNKPDLIILAFQVYPNPCRDYFFVRPVENSIPYSLTLIGSDGRIIKDFDKTKGIQRINMENYGKGLYHLIIQNGLNNETVTIIRN